MPKRPSKQPERKFLEASQDFEISSYVRGQTLPHSWSPDTYARWLFDFLRTDLATLTPGQLLGMRADLWAFVGPEIVENPSWDGNLPTVDVLETLQRVARAGIQRVREGEWFELEAGIKYGIALAGDRVIRGNQRGTFDDLFRAAVMETLQGYWHRLPECPRCHAIFVKVGKQKYCSPTCASRAHWDAFKARRRARDHHSEYERRVKKRLGPNVKAKPRGRK
jgi:hypothetical protein